MLFHFPIGPDSNGDYFAVYHTPGCNVPTVATVCRTHEQATAEALRLNQKQSEIEQAIQAERALRLRGVA